MIRAQLVVMHLGIKAAVVPAGGRKIFASRLLVSNAERYLATSTRPSSNVDSSKSIRSTNGTDNEASSKNSNSDETVILYESPLGHVVSRLRAVSLLSAVTGSIGLPLFCALKGINEAPVGILAFGMTFVAGSCASTAAVHFVFSPYVYSLEQIPIRKCKTTTTKQNESDKSSKGNTDHNHNKDVLLKAVSKSLFLTRTETIFDPATDVTAYKGLRPLCNFIVTTKGNNLQQRPLYVHPEYVYNATLRKQLQLPELQRVENPDDDLI